MHTLCRRRRYRQLRAKPRFWALVIVLSLSVAMFAAVQLFNGLRTYGEAKQEYDTLRLFAPDVVVIGGDEDLSAMDTRESIAPPTQAQPMPTPAKALAEINPEYVGWLAVARTDISYPIVQGADNDKYLTTSFEGRQSKLGAIFIDARCADDFAAPHVIVYGHNARDGSMFGSLAQFLEAGYLEKHPKITVTLPGGEALVYRIFAVQETDVTDAAYRWEFDGADDFATFAADLGVPEGAAQILTLSTCTSGGRTDERLLIHAELE